MNVQAQASPRKIVIVGGGTAGWIGALFILKSQPGAHEVVVVESSKIGIIGAGEGSTGLLVDLLQNRWFDTGIDINNFIEKVDGTIKLGIHHKNWTGDGSSYYAPLDGSSTSQQSPDTEFLHVLSTYGLEKMHMASDIGRHYEAKNFPSYYALHFDGHKIGRFLKEHLQGDNLKVIEKLANQHAANIDKLLSPIPGLSGLQNIIYTFVNNQSKAKALDNINSKAFFEWLPTSKVSAGQQQKIAGLNTTYPGTMDAMFQLVVELMKAKDEVIRELDAAEGDITANTGGKPGGEGYVKGRDSVKLVPRDRWTPFRAD
jgi:tryptophan halogenase